MVKYKLLVQLFESMTMKKLNTESIISDIYYKY